MLSATKAISPRATRRAFTFGAAVLLAMTVTCARAAMPANTFSPIPIPAWMPYQEGTAEVNGTKLYYRDSGGAGVPLFLLHPHTGSALVWSYQQPALVRAGYRVVAYSRRGYYGSSPMTVEGSVPSRDLAALADYLRIGRFAIVAAAAGTAIALDFAMDHPDRLYALVLGAGTYFNTEEADYQQMYQRSLVPGLAGMPLSFRELGPSYRAANIDGTKAWEALEQAARVGAGKPTRPANKLNWENLARVKAPTLFIAGGADLLAPPPMMRAFAQRLPQADMLVLPDAGHSVYWELPDMFNAITLDFLRKHARK